MHSSASDVDMKAEIAETGNENTVADPTTTGGPKAPTAKQMPATVPAGKRITPAASTYLEAANGTTQKDEVKTEAGNATNQELPHAKDEQKAEASATGLALPVAHTPGT